mgnify:FL=1
MKLLLHLAWRNIWRQWKRNLLIMIAVAIGVFSMIIYDALLRGWQLSAIEDTVNNMSGHIKIHAQGYVDDPSVYHHFELTESLRKSLDQNPEIKMWTGRINVPAVVVSERETRGLSLIGIAPQSEKNISFLGGVKLQGEMFQDINSAGVVIGKKMAEQLETRLGKRIVIMTQGKDKQLKEIGLKIVGIYDTGVEALETSFAFISRNKAQKLLGLGNSLTEISIRVQDGVSLESTQTMLKNNVDTKELDTQTWKQLNRQMAIFTEFAEYNIWIWHFIMLIALAFGLVNTLLTAFYERIREFGLFQALGMRPGSILKQVLIEAWLLVTLGLILGFIFGAIGLELLSDGIDLTAFADGLDKMGFRKVWVPIYMWQDSVSIVVMILLLGVFASLFPAWRAVKMDPVEALNKH